MTAEVLIVGGGLSGLALADALTRGGLEWRLVESSERLGGRVLSPDLHGARFDLGPAWFWPGQPRLATLVDRFGLTIFEQEAGGRLRYQDPSGRVYDDRGISSMQGSLRVDGGMAAVTDALAQGLDPQRLETECTVHSLELQDSEVVARTSRGDRRARRVVLSIPPRVAALLEFSPRLSSGAVQAMESVPTWMAGHAKVLAVYDIPHWLEAGYSGDAMSHRGPLMEVHDASPLSGGPYALFGFVGVAAEERIRHRESLLELVREQLIELFGAAMGSPKELLLQDWATIPTVATSRDQAPPSAHPEYGLPSPLRELWGGRLQLGSTETATRFGGYLEGALEAAEAAYRTLARIAA